MTEKEKSGHDLPASGVYALDGCMIHMGKEIISHYPDFPPEVVKWCLWNGYEPRRWLAEQKKKPISQLIEESGGYGLAHGEDLRRIMAKWHQSGETEAVQITLWNQGE